MASTPKRLASGNYYIEYHGPGGSRPSRVFPTAAAARKWAADGEAAIRAGNHVDPRRPAMPFRRWHAKYIDARTVESSTAARNRTDEKRVLAKWGDHRLRDIERIDVDGWINQMIKAGTTPTVIRAQVKYLAACLQAAVDADYLPQNPARRLKNLPPENRHADRILSGLESDLLLDLFDFKWRVFALCGLDAGLRYGEIAGLHAHRVDLHAGEIKVREVIRQDGTLKARPKSKASERTVPILTDRLAEGLAPMLYRPGLVFRSQKGLPMRYGVYLRTVWNRALAEAQLPGVRPTPHDLRHTFATAIANSRVVPMPTLQMWLGHATLAQTLRYVNYSEDDSVVDRARAALARR